MNINRIKGNAFTGKINLGSQVGYSNDIISEKDLIGFIQECQDVLIRDKNLYLSVSLSVSKVILSGQIEPHFQLSFINYPRFPQEEGVLKEEIEALAKALLKKFSQNRIVVEFPQETIMFECKEEIDPRIKKLIQK